METKRNLTFEELVEDVGRVVREVSGIRMSDSESSLAASGVDSLVLLEILSSLEQEFDIVLNETVVEEFYSLSRIARVIQDATRSAPKG